MTICSAISAATRSRAASARTTSTARDGGPDILDGGPGNDRSRIDKLFDRLTSVESS